MPAECSLWHQVTGGRVEFVRYKSFVAVEAKSSRQESDEVIRQKVDCIVNLRLGRDSVKLAVLVDALRHLGLLLDLFLHLQLVLDFVLQIQFKFTSVLLVHMARFQLVLSFKEVNVVFQFRPRGHSDTRHVSFLTPDCLLETDFTLIDIHFAFIPWFHSLPESSDNLVCMCFEYLSENLIVIVFFEIHSDLLHWVATRHYKFYYKLEGLLLQCHQNFASLLQHLNRVSSLRLENFFYGSKLRPARDQVVIGQYVVQIQVRGER
jgi:hypothetical protein